LPSYAEERFVKLGNGRGDMFKMRMAAVLVSCAGLLSAANAETLKISGLYPAARDGATQVESISIENFGGRDGDDLGFAIEKKLQAINFDGEPYFTVMTGRSATDPDAILSGTATARIEEYNTTAYRSRCVERNEKGKCTEHKSRKVPCLKRVIDFDGNLRLSNFSDGRSIFTRGLSDKNEQTICDRDENFSSSRGEIQRMIDKVAYSVRRDLAPIEVTRDIRVLESRKGMEKGQKKAFKAAVKMTKTNEAEACRMWSELAANSAPHGSLAFNIGLCAEQVGDFENALAQYDKASSLLGKKTQIDQGIRRIRDRQQANADWNARYPVEVEQAPAGTDAASEAG